jgi:response regulator RpfG family c-di-GMP phosphodiesterase
VGRPRAVKAAISRAYGGDIHAFATLDRSVHQQFSTMLDVYERNLVSEDTMTHSLATESVSRERVLSTEDLSSDRIGQDFIASRGVNTKSYLETLNVLITLSENTRNDLRGHSAQVARLIQKMAERIGVPELERDAFVIGAYVHDLGKTGSFHLTALNVAEYEGHRLAAQKQLSAPTRLLEAVRLPRVIETGVQAMYERFDGEGIAQGLKGKDIPLLARVLAIVDTYADVTQNPRNPYRQALSANKACDVLKRFAGTIFDPNLVDLFKTLVTGDDIKARLLTDRRRILLVDTDPEETTVLELRMMEQGFEVRLARTAEQALKSLAGGDISLVISELDLEQGDGLSLLAEVRKQPWGKKLPWIVATKRTARGDAQRAFELSVADYVTKPVSFELFTAKVKQILERQAVGAGSRGVSGALREMGLPEIVQVLHHGRKTGRLKVQSGAESGEIHFVAGEVFNALYANLRGEEAFYAMLRLTDGEFALDPAFEAPQRLIRENPESLLLEGMRRLDEAAR